MRRTIAIRVYPSGDYASALTNPSSNHEVRLMYATISGGTFYMGGVVPGDEFQHIDSGVWERIIDTDLVDATRTDYYFVQYRIMDGTWGEWTNAAGCDPLYFNTRNITNHVEQYITTIANSTPKAPTVTESPIMVSIAKPTQWTGGAYIPQGCMVCVEWCSKATNAEPAPEDWITTLTNGINSADVVLYRTGTDFVDGKFINARVRVFNPANGEYSQYSSRGYVELVQKSVEETLGASLADPENIVVAECSTWVANDSISITTKPPARGTHHEIAIQYGGAPSLDSGALKEFTGTIVQTTNSTTIIQKPYSLTSTTTVYIAVCAMAYNKQGDWIGEDASSMFELSVSPVSITSLMSVDMLEGIVDYAASRMIVSNGLTVAKKP